MNNELNIEVSRVFRELIKSDKRIEVLEGSSRSTKTISIIQYIIQDALSVTGHTYTLAREKYTWTETSIILDFIWVLDSLFGMYDSKLHNKSKPQTYKLNGNLIMFSGLDDPNKFKGRKQRIAWVNEAIETQHTAFSQLAMRTTHKVILDFNPSVDEHWIFDKVLTRDDSNYIHSTYKDNKWLEPLIVKEIESYDPSNPENVRQGTADDYLWKVYGLGQRAKIRGQIFPDVNIVKSLPPKHEWTKFFYGIDYGYEHDPTALVLIVYCDKQLWFKELVYEPKLITRIDEKKPEKASIEGKLKECEVLPSYNIWSENTPNIIEELRMSGFSIRKADKGPGSVLAGISLLKSFTINITEDSMNFIKESKNYKWSEDKNTGEFEQKPVDAYNHCWDAARYGVTMEMRINKEKRAAFIPGKSISNEFKSVEDKLRYLDNVKKHTSNFD